MRKFVFVFVLVVAVMAFATESGPSNTVGFVTYSTTAGANYVTVSFDNEEFATSEDVAGMFEGSTLTPTVIARYNNETHQWEAANFVVGPNFWVGTFDVNMGNNLYVFTGGTDEFTYATYGDVPEDYSVVYNLYESTNYIAVPLNIHELMGETVMASAIGEEIGDVLSVAKYNNATNTWGSANFIVGPNFWVGDFEVEIGDALYVFRSSTASSTVWPAPVAAASSASDLKIKSKVETDNESPVDMLNMKKK